MSAPLTIKVVNQSKHPLPKYATIQAAGLDLKANIDSPIVLKPLQRQLIATGLFIELPNSYEAQIRPRSGLAFKNGITVLNSPGTIDADYRGEVKVLLVNLSDTDFTINDGERIAQMVIAKHEQITWEQVTVLEDSSRGAGGFGSTGKK
jgi:dUTP pyrophosphatase